MVLARQNQLLKCAALGALSAALALLCVPAGGDELPYRFHRQFSADTLLVAKVRHLVQDPSGFLWFTQRRTLHTYDGNTVETIVTFESGEFTALASDLEGNIWLGTTRGLEVWNRDTQRSQPWQPSTSGPFFTTPVVSLAVDSRGAVWAASSGGRLARIGPGSAPPDLYSAADIEPENPRSLSLTRVTTSSRGEIWVGTGKGKLFHHVPGETGFDSLDLGPNRSISALTQGRDGKIWVGTRGGELLQVGEEALTMSSRVISSAAPITALAEDPQGHLWVGTEAGVKVLVPGNNRLAPVYNNPESPGEPSTDNIQSLYLDRGSVIWIAAGEGGVWTASTGASAFTHWQPGGKGPTAPVTSITTTPDGSLWVGTFEAGLFRRLPNGQLRRYGRDRDRSGQPEIGDASAMALLPDGPNKLYIGTVRTGLSLLDVETETFQHYQPDPEGQGTLNAQTVLGLVKSATGEILIATFSGGLNVLDPETGVFRAYTHNPDDPATLSENQVRSVLEDSSGRLWVGTRYSGLNLKLPDAGGFRHFRHDPNDPTSLAHDAVMVIIEDSRGEIWLGTYMGLQRVVVDGDAVSFEHYGPEQGLAGLKVLSILEDKSGSLWLSTGQGVSRFDRASKSFTNLARHHGLPPVGFNYNAYAKAADGRFHLGSNYGVTSFDPEEVSLETYTPKIVLTGAQRLAEPVDLPPPGAEQPELSFSHRDSFISFEFSLLDFTESDRNRYEHLLQGFDEDWIDVGNHRRATYSNLPPGQYTFRVRGANSEGVWSAEDATLAIRILPPPWATWWAYTLYVLAAFGLALGYVLQQARKQRQEAQYTQRLEREVHRRTRELAEQNEKLRYANELLEVASVTDSLTGVRNRRFLLTTIHQDIALVERAIATGGDEARQDSAFVFILFDLDGFKEINDSHGHSAGDLVLFQIRDLLNQACRSSDTLIRWGGDEFLIVAREATRAHVEALAERIRQSVADHLFDIGTAQPVQLTCSLGFACYPFVASNPRLYSWEEVIDIADRALYVAKRHGPNMWAGIFGTDQTEETPAEDLLVMIMERPELLGAEGSIRLVTSRPTPTSAGLRPPAETQRAS